MGVSRAMDHFLEIVMGMLLEFWDGESFAHSVEVDDHEAARNLVVNLFGEIVGLGVQELQHDLDMVELFLREIEL